jgi:hypothetical protein
MNNSLGMFVPPSTGVLVAEFDHSVFIQLLIPVKKLFIQVDYSFYCRLLYNGLFVKSVAIKRIVLLLLVGLNTMASAQKKEVISKEATIEYLNQKAKEEVGHTKISVGQKIFIIRQTVYDAHFKKTATGVEIYISFHTANSSANFSAAFNPKHIVSITNISKETLSLESAIGIMELKFIGRTALFNNNGDTTTVNKVDFHFLQTDPDNPRRIEKAFLHLRDLFKAEDATFSD